MKDIYIEESIDKEPYVKILSNDKVINITGESGSGKSTYSKMYLNDDNYIVIDTDEIKGNRYTNNKYGLEMRKYLIDKYGDNMPDICKDFYVYYQDILDYFKDSGKTIVIDSAQFRNLRDDNDLKLLKGKVIIIRTCIDTCYKRCIDRWKELNENYTENELIKYSERKKGMYKWYLLLNKFISKIDNI